MKPSGRQSIVQGAVILTASTLIVKFVGALFKIPLANILGGVGMSYFVSAYDVLIPIYSMTVTGLGVAVSRMVSQQGEGNGSAASILKTARVMFFIIGSCSAALLFFGAAPLTGLIGNPSAALSVCCIAPSVLFSCLSSAYRGYFQGRQNMLPTAKSQILEACVKLVAGISAAWLIHSNLTASAAAGTLGWPGTPQQIELRILAHITGDEHMQQAFLNGEDIHRSTAAKIYGIPQSEVTPRLRSSAKAINFGIMYGKGAYSLAKDIGVTVKEADAFLKNYLAAFPNVSGYMDKTIADAKANGYVSTLFGRRRALPELASSNFNVRSSGERMARNTPIQGTAADVIKLAMVRVWKRLRDEKMASRLILTVHDELIVEAPEAEAEQAARILREEMEGCVQYAVPLSTDVHAGKNWLEAH